MAFVVPCCLYSRPSRQIASTLCHTCTTSRKHVASSYTRRRAFLGSPLFSFSAPHIPSVALVVVSSADSVGNFAALSHILQEPQLTELIAAIAGGSVGVMGTLVSIEQEKQLEFEERACVYCRGEGSLACGVCCTVGCEHCQNGGRTACYNCGGTGHTYLQTPYARMLGILGGENDAPL